MYRVIIVDDEPLILAITWEEYDCTIIGKATNGPSAFDMIMELKPDIVITDIRMPVLNGLELVEKCKDEGCTFSFIVLTNLEEFHLVRKALSLGASDYLVKLDLNEEALAASLARAKDACELLVSQKQHQLLNDLIKDNQENLSKNYLSQLLLSGNAPEVPDKVKEEYPEPFLLLFSVRPINIAFETDDDPYDFHQISKQLMDILGGIATRTFLRHTLLEFRTDTYLLAASLKDGDVFETVVSEFCQKMAVALKTYFEFSAVFGVSTRKKEIPLLTDALAEAQTALEVYYFESSSPVVFYQGQRYHMSRAKIYLPRLRRMTAISWRPSLNRSSPCLRKTSRARSRRPAHASTSIRICIPISRVRTTATAISFLTPSMWRGGSISLTAWPIY